MLLDFLRCIVCRAPFHPTMPEFLPVRFYWEKQVYVGYCRDCVPLTVKNPEVLAYVLDILNQPNLTSTADGWMAIGPLERLKCPLCQVEFTRNGRWDPVVMWKNFHLLCRPCHEEESAKPKCTVCNVKCGKSGDNASLLMRYLAMSGVSDSGSSPEPELQTEKCGQCHKRLPVDQLFRCEDCTMTLCSLCAVRKHRDHALIDRGALKIVELEENTTAQLREHFDGLNNIITHVHTEIAAGSRGLIEKIEQALKIVGRQMELAEALRICGELRKKLDRFEEKFEKYLPHARIYEDDLKKLSDEIEMFTLKFE
ncbi:unnamed protein product, partial [Mesorhabditis spiculigera]